SAGRAATVLGDHFDLVVGVGEHAVYVAGGADALPALKRALAASTSPQKVSPVQARLAIAEVAQLASATNYAWMVTVLTSGLAATPGKDHLTFPLTPITRGLLYRVEIEEGLLGASASMVLALWGIPTGL